MLNKFFKKSFLALTIFGGLFGIESKIDAHDRMYVLPFRNDFFGNPVYKIVSEEEYNEKLEAQAIAALIVVGAIGIYYLCEKAYEYYTQSSYLRGSSWRSSSYNYSHDNNIYTIIQRL